MSTVTKTNRRVTTSLRVSLVCDQLWDQIAEHTGLNRTSVLEVAIRRLAREEGIAIPAPDAPVALPVNPPWEEIRASMERIAQIAANAPILTPDDVSREAIYFDHD